MNNFYKTAYDAGVEQALQDYGLHKRGQAPQVVESVGQLMAGAGGFLKRITGSLTKPTDLTRMQRWLRSRLVGSQGSPESYAAMRQATAKARKLEGLGVAAMGSPRAGSVNEALGAIF